MRIDKAMESAHMSDNLDEERRRGGRPAAGTDPNKRRQIIEGAGRIFSVAGFEAASMSDVAREADVSKATLYVYFPSKEQLFAAVCAERRDRNISELLGLLDVTQPLEPVLEKFGTEIVRKMSQPAVVAAHRVVIGVAERMPEIGQEFFESGPMRAVAALAAFLDHHVAAGRLIIDDTTLAAMQYLELVQASIFRARLYGVAREPAADAEIARVVTSGVRVIMAAYGRPPRD